MARLFSSNAALLAAALLASLATAAPYTPRLRTGRHLQEEACVSSLQWTSEGGELLVNGQPFHLKGVRVVLSGRTVCVLIFVYPTDNN